MCYEAHPHSSTRLDERRCKEKKAVSARFERSDICAVPRAMVVGEAMLAWVLAAAYRKKFGGDSMEEIEAYFKDYLDYLESFHSLEDGEK